MIFNRIDNKLKGLARIIFCLSVVSIPLSIFIYPIAIILCGIVSSYLIYGFGELIGHVRNIDCSLNGELKIVGKVKEKVDINKI